MKKLLSILSAIFITLYCIVPVCAQEPAQAVGGYPSLLQLHIPFTGSWRLDDNPLLIEPGDFADITNLRPTPTGIEGVSGYSKINSAPFYASYNYTDFTETDVPARVTVADHIITIADLDTDEDVYVYKDEGAANFDGDFEHQFNFECTASTDGICGLWALTNNVDGLYGLDTSDFDHLALFNESNDSFDKVADPSNLPAGTGYGAAFNNDGSLMAVAHVTSPYITIYNTSDWSKVADPGTLPTGAGLSVAFNDDGSLMAVAHDTSPYITIYNTSDWSKVADPGTLPAETGYGVAFNDDGSLMAVGHFTSPYITIYNTSDWSKVADPGTLPTGAGRGVAFNDDGSLMAVAHGASPYITIYNTSDWSKVADPGTLPAGTGYGAAFNNDGSLMAVAHVTSPYITIYNTSDWSKVADPSNLPAGTGYGAAFNNDGSLMAVAHVTSPYITIYNTSDWSKVADPGTLPTGAGYGVAFNDGSLLTVSHATSPYVTIYNGIYLYLTLRETNGAVNTTDSYISYTSLAQNIDYYITTERDEAVGTYGTLYSYIYSDEARSTLVDTLTVTLTEKQDFQYIFGMISYDGALGGNTWDGTISNLTGNIYSDVKSGYHFTKDQPTETHVLIQAADSAGNTAIFDNQTAIPSTGNFESAAVYTEASGASTGVFASAGQGYVTYCNTKESLIWGGDEAKCGAFILCTATAIEDCEDAWDELVDGDVTSTADATDYKVGAASAKLVVGDLVAAGDILATEVTTTLDLSDQTTIRLWLKSSVLTASGDLQLLLDDTALCASPVETINIPILAAGVWTQADLTLANPASDTAIISIGIKYTVDIGACTVWVDDVKTTPISANEIDNARDFTLQVQNTLDTSSEIASIGNNYLCWYVGSPVPLKGVKYYVKTANGIVSTMTAKEYTGSVWSALSLTDNTAAGGISLAQTGTVTWSDTQSTSKKKYLDGTVWYWYQFELSAGSAELSQVTLDAAMQPITNIWDSLSRQCAACLLHDGTTFQDYSDSVNSEITTDVLTLDSLATANYVLLGFNERQQGLNITIPPGKENSTAASVLTVSYWDGDSLVAVTALQDGTIEGAISLSKSGVVSWSPPNKEVEFPRSPTGEGSLFYYHLTWDQILDTETEIYYISGIGIGEEVLPYKLPILFQNRTLLCNRNGAPNEILVSSENTPYVYNGSDSTRISLGSYSDIVAGKSLSNSYESSIDAVAVVCKKTATWTLREPGDGGPNFLLQPLSDTTGCIAPLSMATCELAGDMNIVMWLSHGGPVISEGVKISPALGMEPYFDPADDLFLGYSVMEGANGFFDSVRKEYNLIVGSTWLVYNIQLNKWFKKEPPQYPAMGWLATDTYGGQHTYLAFSDGIVRRNENTNAFDGSDIAQSATLADIPLGGMGYISQIDFLKLTAKAKNTGTNELITVKHRADGDDSWTTLDTVEMYESGKRYVQHTQRPNKQGISHQFKLSADTDDQAKGMEVLSLDLFYRPLRTDTQID